MCTSNYQALKTTVLNHKSGLLSSINYQFKEYMLRIYNDKHLFDELSKDII